MGSLLPPVVAELLAQTNDYQEKITQAKEQLQDLTEGTDTDVPILGSISDLEDKLASARASLSELSEQTEADPIVLLATTADFEAKISAAQAQVADLRDSTSADQIELRANLALLDADLADAKLKIESAVAAGDADPFVLRATTTELDGQLAATNVKLQATQAEMAATATEGDGMFAKLASAGGKAGLVLAAATAGAVFAATDLGEKYQESTNQIAAASDESVAAANKVTQAFLNTGFTTTFSAAQIASAYAPVAGQMTNVEGHALTAAQAMSLMSASMDLSEASGDGLSNATADLSSVLQNYGLKANAAAAASNILYTTANAAGVSVDTVTSSFTKLKAGLGAATPPLSEVGAYLLDLADHGETGKKGITAATTALSYLITATSGVTKAQQDQDTVFKQMSPDLQHLVQQYQSGAISYTTFQKASENLGQSQYQLATAWNADSAAVLDARTKLNEMGITVVNAQNQFVGMGSVITQLHAKIQGMTNAQALATVQQVFGNTAGLKMLATIQAGPAAYAKATAAVTKQHAAQNAAAKMAATLHGQVETLEHGFEDLATKLGVMLVPIVTKVVHGLSSMVIWMEKNSTVTKVAAGIIGGVLLVAIGAYTVSMASAAVATIAATWPILAIVAAVALLVGGFIYAYDHCKTFRDFVQASFQRLKDVVSISIHIITDAVKFLIHWCQEWASDFHTGVQTVKHDWDSITSAIHSGATSVISWFQKLPSNLSAAVSGMGSLLVTKGGDLISGLLNGIVGIWDTVTTWFHNLPGNIVSAVGSVTSTLASKGDDVLTGFWNGVVGVWNTVTTWFHNLPGKVVSAVGTVTSTLTSQGGSLISGMLSGITGAWSTVTTAVGKFPGDIEGALSNAGTWLVSIGQQIVQGLISGITSKVTAAVTAITNLGGSLTTAAKNVLKISSPSRVFAEIGSNVGAGLQQGISGSVATVASAGMKLASAAVASATPKTTQLLAMAGGFTSAAKAESLAASTAAQRSVPVGASTASGSGGGLGGVTIDARIMNPVLNGTPAQMLSQMQAMIQKNNQQVVTSLGQLG